MKHTVNQDCMPLLNYLTSRNVIHEFVPSTSMVLFPIIDYRLNETLYHWQINYSIEPHSKLIYFGTSFLAKLFQNGNCHLQTLKCI